MILCHSIPSTAAASGLELAHPLQSALPIVVVSIFIQLVEGVYQPKKSKVFAMSKMRICFAMTSD